MRHLSAAACLGILSLTVMVWPAGAEATGATTNGATVLVLPFAPLNPAEAQPWLGKSIQQSLASDLLAAASGRVTSADNAAGDAAAAVDAARRAGSAYVLFGNFATAGSDLRITGQVFDANTGKAITAIKATGPLSDVFTLEDELTEQIRRRLVLTSSRPTTEPAQAAGESVPPMEPLRVAQAQQPVDPYVQTYVAPLNASASPDRQQLDYNYYLGQPGGSPYLFCGWYGCGLGCGGGFNYYGFGGAWGSSSAWGGVGGASHGATGVNPTAGTAIAPGVVFHGTSHASGRAGGAAHR
jgi:TolB-like protein